MNATSEDDDWVYSNKANNRSDDSPNEMTDENVEMINTTVPERRQTTHRSYQTIDEVDAIARSPETMMVLVDLTI